MLIYGLYCCSTVLIESHYEESVMLDALIRIAKQTTAIFDEKAPSAR
jgi:hypothetical protein